MSSGSHPNFGGVHIPCHHSSNVDNVTVGPKRGDACGSRNITILLVGGRNLYAYEARVSPGSREWLAKSSVRSTRMPIEYHLLVPRPSDVVRKGHVHRVAWGWPCYLKSKNIRYEDGETSKKQHCEETGQFRRLEYKFSSASTEGRNPPAMQEREGWREGKGNEGQRSSNPLYTARHVRKYSTAG